MQKRFHVEANHVVYEDWKIKIHELLTDELLEEKESVPTQCTFVLYKAKHAHQLTTRALE